MIDVSPNFIGRPPTRDFEEVLTDRCSEIDAVIRLSERMEQDYQELVTTFRQRYEIWYCDGRFQVLAMDERLTTVSMHQMVWYTGKSRA